MVGRYHLIAFENNIKISESSGYMDELWRKLGSKFGFDIFGFKNRNVRGEINYPGICIFMR